MIKETKHVVRMFHLPKVMIRLSYQVFWVAPTFSGGYEPKKENNKKPHLTVVK